MSRSIFCFSASSALIFSKMMSFSCSRAAWVGSDAAMPLQQTQPSVAAKRELYCD